MSRRWTHSDFANLSRLGWVKEPSPVVALPSDAHAMDLAWFGLKRDDLIDGLSGGSKVRKLDVLLASAPWTTAPVWESVGAIGSGQLTALTEAAKLLDRRVLAHTFWEPLSDGVEANLAQLATGPVDLRWHKNRITLGITAAHAVLGWHRPPNATIPAGASNPMGTLGAVLGALELVAQVESGALPAPDTLIVPLGSGGMVAGLLLGTALGGLPVRIRAISTVERWMGGVGRIRSLALASARLLRNLGHEVGEADPTDRLRIDWSEVGPGYGIATAASERAAAWMGVRGVWGEPIYGGKALAWLLAHHGQLRGQRVLFWHTPRRALDPPPTGWEDHLPTPIRKRLLAARADSHGLTRRRWLWIAAAPWVLALPWAVPTHPTEAWRGELLDTKEAAVVVAAAEALLPDRPGDPLPEGTSWTEIALRVDRYLVGLPKRTMLEIRGLLGLLERGTLLGLALQPLTRLTPLDRKTALLALRHRGRLLATAFRGIRDMLLLARWQDPRLWTAIGYPGPWVPGPRPGEARRRDGLPARPSPYDRLVAVDGALPPGVIR